MKIKSETQITNENRWAEHLRKLEEHKGTLTSYCQANGISLANIRYWRTKIETKSPPERLPQAKRKKVFPFIPVQVMPPEVRVQEQRLPDPKWLAELIVQLGMACGGRR
jgi:hypothetical protein